MNASVPRWHHPCLQQMTLLCQRPGGLVTGDTSEVTLLGLPHLDTLARCHRHTVRSAGPPPLATSHTPPAAGPLPHRENHHTPSSARCVTTPGSGPPCRHNTTATHLCSACPCSSEWASVRWAAQPLATCTGGDRTSTPTHAPAPPAPPVSQLSATYTHSKVRCTSAATWVMVSRCWYKQVTR